MDMIMNNIYQSNHTSTKYSRTQHYAVYKIAAGVTPYCNIIYMNTIVRSTLPGTMSSQVFLHPTPDML